MCVVDSFRLIQKSKLHAVQGPLWGASNALKSFNQNGINFISPLYFIVATLRNIPYFLRKKTSHFKMWWKHLFAYGVIISCIAEHHDWCDSLFCYESSIDGRVRWNAMRREFIFTSIRWRCTEWNIKIRSFNSKLCTNSNEIGGSLLSHKKKVTSEEEKVNLLMDGKWRVECTQSSSFNTPIAIYARTLYKYLFYFN